MTTKTHIRVVGAGPAGLMAADVLSSAGCKVTLIDHHRQPARKFLLAGRGGLNLTHSEPLESFLNSYGEAKEWLQPAIQAFPPQAIRQWCHDLGIETFVGSSGRVFPTCMKASPVLRAWLNRLRNNGVELQSNTPWQGFDDQHTILALGGASWPELGSNASWVDIFKHHGIEVSPLQASNVRLPVLWSDYFRTKFSGSPIKNVAIKIGAESFRGEIMISQNGIEGGAIYASSGAIRQGQVQSLTIDLKPDLTESLVQQRIENRAKKDSRSNFLRKAFHLTPAAIALMHEGQSENPKAVTIQLSGQGELRRAISTAGGVTKSAFNENFQLHKFPITIVVGEMLDWDAPTGGYLLQACLSTAHFAASRLLQRL